MDRQPLLERDQLLLALADHAAAAALGAGRLVFVGGEAGAGKTALVREFGFRQAGRATLLSGACDPMSVPRPLAPVVDFAASVGEEFAARVETGAQRDRLFALLLDRLKNAKRPHLVVLEDLHWADDATLDLLRYLGRRVAVCSTLLIGTYRDDEVGPGHPLRRVLGDLAGVESVHRLTVPPFTEAAVKHLAGGQDVDAAELHRRTGGNPFFVTEVLAAGGHGVPVRVGDAVLARAARLSQDARAVLELAATIGLGQDLELLERLAPNLAAIEECLSVGMLTGHGHTTTFRHELAREAVLGAMSAARRRHAHAAVLAALEAAAPAHPGDPAAHAQGEWLPPESLAVLAHHAAGSGDPDKVLRYAPAAGRLAMRLRAFREAREQFKRALPYAAALGADAHAELLGEYAGACANTSHDRDAMEAHRAALELWRDFGSPERVALATLRYGGALWNLGRKHEAERLVLEAVERVSALPEVPERASVYQGHASLRMLDRDAKTALTWARRAVASGRRTGNWRAVASAYNTMVGVLTTSERIVEARRYHRACVELIEEGHAIDTTVGIASAKVMMGSGLGEVYRFVEAEALLTAASEISSQIDLDSTNHYALAWRSLCHLYLGRWREVGEVASWVLSRPTVALISRIMAGVALGRLRVRRGDPEVWPVLDKALEEAVETDTLQRLAPVRAARAEAALAAGANDRAHAEASAALPLALEHRHRWFVGELSYLIWRAGYDPELPEWVDGPFASQVRGEPLAAARAWRRLGCPFEEARALFEADEPAALTRALALFDSLGANPAAGSVAARLRQLGVRGVRRGPRRSTEEHPVGLTARERQVLGQLEQGLKNSEIAERNRVSQRTVDSQVSAVLAKLGVRSRTEAVAKAHRLGLVNRQD